MAVDVYYSDNFVGMISPRLSFSRDLDESESIPNPINDYSCRIDSTFDFAFNVDASVTFESSSADELFSDGKIIPSCLKSEEVKESEVSQRKLVIPCLDLPQTEERKKSLKEFLEDSIEEEEEPNSNDSATNNAAKSFWQFRRSNSLNCDRNQRKGLIGSWKILSRSGSTGKFLEKIVEEEKQNNSNFHTKLFRKFSRNNSLKDSEKLSSSHSNNNVSNKGLIIGSSKMLRRSHSTSDNYFTKSESRHFRRSNSTGSAPNSNGNKLKKQTSQKQQQNQLKGGKVKDNFRGYYGNNHYTSNYNSLKISPVLNLPSPYISRVSLDLFSFGSLFCNGSNSKDRKKRK